MDYFVDLDERTLSGALIIIDVDGTLTSDKNRTIDPPVREKLRALGGLGEVYLFSHGLPERTRMLADENGVHFLESTHRKPSRRVIEKLESQGKRLVVVGDKSLTDGLFAANIGARFVPVRRIRHEHDDLYVRITYALDDAASYAIRAVFPVLPYLLLMRPAQWVKNALVFAPLFFASEAFDLAALGRTALAALIFCGVASAMYVFNDIRDAEADRKHPSKKSRPVASGVVTVSHAWALFLFLVALSFGGVLLLPAIAPAIALYIAGNIAYSLILKRVAVVDIALVALFYVIRIIAGGAAAAVYVSPWIVLCVLFGALFIVVGKRRAESSHTAKRAVFQSYSERSLDLLLAASATLAVASYGLYSILGAHSAYAVYSTIFVFVAIARLVNQMYAPDGDAEYPESLIFKDPWVLAMGILWIFYMAALFYLG